MTEKPFIHNKAFYDFITNFIFHEDVAKHLFKLINKKGVINVVGKIHPDIDDILTDVILEGLCNATDLDGDNLSYYFIWKEYLDNELNNSEGYANNSENGWEEGTEVNVNNLSIAAS